MAYIKKLRGRGVSGVVTAYGEVLFMPGGQVNNWTNRFAARVGAATREAAPRNKRVRWSHYGKPLKQTITASRPEFKKTARGARLYAAVGSTAPYAYYVDQGTGIYGGNGAYEAKILPPWQRGEGSLYEATWRPGGQGSRLVAPVMIKGQRGQGFFDKGLKRGFQSMRMRSYQVPGGPQVADAMASFPRGLESPGNTPANGAFRAQLEQWRAWRDEAWGDGRLGRTIRPERPAERKPQKTKPVKPVKPVKPTKPPKPTKPDRNAPLRAKQDRAVAQFQKQNPDIRVLGRITSGLVVKTAKGRYVIPWSRLYNLL